MQDNSALGRAMAMVRDLRARCPWDRAQTRESLRPYLVEEVLELGHGEPWERIKRRERQGRTLVGLVPTLPSLLMAYRLQERAAAVGFDWPDAVGPARKVREELSGVEEQLGAERNPE